MLGLSDSGGKMDWISIVALFVSICTFFYVVNKFHFEWRPWVGIYKNHIEPLNDVSLIIRFEISNYGKLPAKKVSNTIKLDGKSFNPDATQTIIFPGQRVVLKDTVLGKRNENFDIEVLIKYYRNFFQSHITYQKFTYLKEENSFVSKDGDCKTVLGKA